MSSSITSCRKSVVINVSICVYPCLNDTQWLHTGITIIQTMLVSDLCKTGLATGNLILLGNGWGLAIESFNKCHLTHENIERWTLNDDPVKERRGGVVLGQFEDSSPLWNIPQDLSMPPS